MNKSRYARVDVDLRLGLGSSSAAKDRRRRLVQQRRMWGARASSSGYNVCSYCNRCFVSLQALGGHQTAHRREIEELRRQHQHQHQEAIANMMAPPIIVTATPLDLHVDVANLHDQQHSSAVNLDLTLGRDHHQSLDLTLRL